MKSQRGAHGGRVLLPWALLGATPPPWARARAAGRAAHAGVDDLGVDHARLRLRRRYVGRQGARRPRARKADTAAGARGSPAAAAASAPIMVDPGALHLVVGGLPNRRRLAARSMLACVSAGPKAVGGWRSAPRKARSGFGCAAGWSSRGRAVRRVAVRLLLSPLRARLLPMVPPPEAVWPRGRWPGART